MLNVEDVSKSFGSTRALEQVTLRLEPGAVVGLIGHNGAGKTTLMRMAVGPHRPDRGRVTIGGVAAGQFGNLAGLVGASFDASTLPGGWSALTALQATAALSGIPAERVREVLAMVGTTGAAKRRTRTYSMGMRQQLAIALALIAQPRVLILDEPTNALDPTACHDLRTWIRKHAEAGNSVLVSSHNLPELEQVADRVVVIQKSRIIRDATNSDLLTGGASLSAPSGPTCFATSSAGPATTPNCEIARSLLVNEGTARRTSAGSSPNWAAPTGCRQRSSPTTPDFCHQPDERCVFGV